MDNLYDTLYRECDYNEPGITGCEAKWQLISPFVERWNTKFAVDFGCGRGFYLRKMIERRILAVGVEFSRECCQRWLADVPHLCMNIVDYVFAEVDLALCMDVLEHVPDDSLWPILRAIHSSARRSLLGIANHSDVQAGKELHLIQQPLPWWNERLRQVWRYVDVLHDGGRFFVFRCV